MNLTAHDRIQYLLTGDNNNIIIIIIVKYINLMFKKRKELLEM